MERIILKMQDKSRTLNRNAARATKVMLIQPKSYSRVERELDAYELEREIDFLTEPSLPAGITTEAIQNLSVV
jgi:hypothetical protein